jgi:cell division septum initiation protein DivIVA
MELLDLLERRVDDLLTEIVALRAENRRLRENAVAGQHKIEEIASLQQQLEQVKQIRGQMLARLDALLNRIEDSSGET